MILAGVALIPSATAPLWLGTNIVGFVIAIIVAALEWSQSTTRSKSAGLSTP
jgi:hypothetical protein